MGNRLLHVTHIARFEVHRSSTNARLDNGHHAFAADVVLPLIRILMPMKLPHPAGMYGDDVDVRPRQLGA